MGDNESNTADPPRRVRRLAARLTRQALAAETDAARRARARRDAALEPYGYTARYRDEDDTLVLYPTDWHGTRGGDVDFDRIDDPDRAVEIPLSGAGDPDDWAAVAAANRAVVDRIRSAHGSVHGANAEAFATFMNNHRARRIETASPSDVREFREEYFPRNAWPSEAQRTALDDSLERIFEAVDREVPTEEVESG